MRGLSAYHRAFSAVLAMFALVAAFVLATATPARAGENTFVEVTPNTAQAGTRSTSGPVATTPTTSRPP